jgi:hypothetical protein
VNKKGVGAFTNALSKLVADSPPTAGGQQPGRVGPALAGKRAARSISLKFTHSCGR